MWPLLAVCTRRGLAAVTASAPPEVSKALRQLSRARHSLKAGVEAAVAAGPDWDWLANDLRNENERLLRTLEHGRKKAEQLRQRKRMEKLILSDKW